jgi:hypothetical protein
LVATATAAADHHHVLLSQPQEQAAAAEPIERRYSATPSSVEVVVDDDDDDRWRLDTYLAGAYNYEKTLEERQEVWNQRWSQVSKYADESPYTLFCSFPFY